MSKELGKLHELVSEQAVEASELRFATHPALPHRVFTQVGNVVTIHEAPPAYRQVVLDGIEALVHALKGHPLVGAARYGGEELPGAEGEIQPEVFVSPSQVFAWLDRRTRRERVTVPLVWTHAALQLAEIAKGGGLEVKPPEARRVLRQAFGARAEEAVLALSNLSFRDTSEASSKAVHGVDDFGARVERAVVNAAEVPESFTIHTPLWAIDNPERQEVPTLAVPVRIHLDTEKRCAVLDVNLDELSEEVRSAVHELVGVLQAELPGVGVYAGAPF